MWRITQLETEFKIARRATELLKGCEAPAKVVSAAISVMTAETLGRGERGLAPGGALSMPCGPQGLSGRRKRRHIERPDAIALDLVDWSSARPQRDRLWVTDIIEYPTREKSSTAVWCQREKREEGFWPRTNVGAHR